MAMNDIIKLFKDYWRCKSCKAINDMSRKACRKCGVNNALQYSVGRIDND